MAFLTKELVARGFRHIQHFTRVVDFAQESTQLGCHMKRLDTTSGQTLYWYWFTALATEGALFNLLAPHLAETLFVVEEPFALAIIFLVHTEMFLLSHFGQVGVWQ